MTKSNHLGNRFWQQKKLVIESNKKADRIWVCSNTYLLTGLFCIKVPNIPILVQSQTKIQRLLWLVFLAYVFLLSILVFFCFMVSNFCISGSL